MTGFNRIFFDTAPIIYYLDNDEKYFEKIRRALYGCFNQAAELVTSVITVEEYCVHPYKTGNLSKVEQLDNFLKAAGFSVTDIDIGTARAAASLRARYPGFKSMDALQLASAMEYNCDLFLTNDTQLRQCGEIRVMLADELSE